MASDDGYVFVFDGLKEGASGLVGEGPVMVEVAVPSVLGDLGGMDEDVAFYEGLLALRRDEDAHVARGVAGSVYARTSGVRSVSSVRVSRRPRETRRSTEGSMKGMDCLAWISGLRKWSRSAW